MGVAFGKQIFPVCRGMGPAAKNFFDEEVAQIPQNHSRIQDNGQGFNMKKVQMGLESMRERVEPSGGELMVESKIARKVADIGSIKKRNYQSGLSTD